MSNLKAYCPNCGIDVFTHPQPPSPPLLDSPDAGVTVLTFDCDCGVMSWWRQYGSSDWLLEMAAGTDKLSQKGIFYTRGGTTNTIPDPNAPVVVGWDPAAGQDWTYRIALHHGMQLLKRPFGFGIISTPVA